MAGNDQFSTHNSDKDMRRDPAQGGQAMPISQGATSTPTHASDAPASAHMTRAIPTSDARLVMTEEDSGTAYANPYTGQEQAQRGGQNRYAANGQGRSMSGRMGYWAAVGLLAAIPATAYMKSRRKRSAQATPISQGSVVERIARVLAAQRISANAQGSDHNASHAIDKQWRAYIPDARAVLRTLREPDAQMAKVGDARVWDNMVRTALDQPARF